MSRPRLLLFPLVTELEWVIRPELEQWADVATFDLPGVGAEPPVERLDRQTIIDRCLHELDRRGWDSYTLVADAPALPTAVRIAHSRPSSVEAMALGHACLVRRMEGERPTENREVAEAFAQLAQNDWGASSGTGSFKSPVDRSATSSLPGYSSESRSRSGARSGK